MQSNQWYYLLGRYSNCCCFRVIAEMMEDSHFNSSYFWSPIPTVPGQVSLNKKSRLCSFFGIDVKKLIYGVFCVYKKRSSICSSKLKNLLSFGQIENAMFLNKVKEQQEKSASFSPSSASHYQTALLTIPTSGAKTDGGGQAGSVAPLHPPHSTQNLLPVPSTGIMTAGESVFANRILSGCRLVYAMIHLT